jgi:uncharacterized protein
MAQIRRFISRRKFLGTLGLAGLGATGYGAWIEPSWLQVGRHEVRLGSATPHSPLKILHLSDLHASPVVSLEFISKAILLGLNEKPDLICLTGDFITRQFDQFAEYKAVLKPLAASAPAFACLGNHDGGMWAARRGGYPDTALVRDVLESSGMELLHNVSKQVQVKDWNLTVVGLGDTWAKEIQPLMAFAQPTPAANTTTLVLSHNPDTKTELKNFTWDLMLCGHTHGGQLKLPLLGTPFAPVRDHTFVEGLHRWNDRWIHITRGVGNLHGVRFNCPPEVSLLTLVG